MYRGVVLLLALIVGGAAHAAQPSRPGWAVANGDLPSRRATDLTVITAASARRLRVLWRFRLPRRARRRPRARLPPGPALYTDSLLVLAGDLQAGSDGGPQLLIMKPG
jgi:predicted alpha/beta-hydrolase family hydrolase